jgi:hypothetical protein
MLRIARASLSVLPDRRSDTGAGGEVVAAVLNAIIIELLRHVSSGPPSMQGPLRVPISLKAGVTVVQALSTSAQGKSVKAE